MQATISDSATKPCRRPSRAGVQTVGDLAAFSIDQEAAIGECEVQRDHAVTQLQDLNAAIAAQARATAPRPWWRVW